ncbi:MAG: N-acetylmuramoyl-L-alanine amidase [Clostridia bacterium]|nr:N-acetylmuramoyl-L-alanine amidase [Clostridia bacterium]MBR5006615.1 N-acetylmuramoyl-L-alanine amidase [Clostridia bacterium]
MNKKILIILFAALVCVAFVLGIVVFVVSVGESHNTPKPTEDPYAETPEPTGEQATTEPSFTEEPTATPDPGPLAGLIIGIDPGHQRRGNSEKEPCAPWDASKNAQVNNGTMKAKTTSGTSGKFTNVDEYVVTLDISLKIKAHLEALGATVVMTRETADVDLSNIDRAEICNKANCHIVLRIHCNGADNPAVNGVEAWIRGNGDGSDEYKALGAYEKKLAEALLTYYCEATGATKRNVNTSDNYTGLNWSTVPSIIIECGFMSNEEEDNLLVSPDYQEKIATGIANWAVAYSGTLLNR